MYLQYTFVVAPCLASVSPTSRRPGLGFPGRLSSVVDNSAEEVILIHGVLPPELAG